MTIKPMAAGRTTPFVGLNFVWNTIRDCDMVTVGCFSRDEAAEDIEISLAVLERRFPEMEKRSSPNPVSYTHLYDISNMFIDSITKVVTDEDIKDAETALADIEKVCQQNNVNLVVTASIDASDAPEFLKKYL